MIILILYGWEGVKILRDICSAINPSKAIIRNLHDDMLVPFVDMPAVSNDGYIEQSIDRTLGELRKGSYTYFAEGDIILAKITPCMENGKCAIATGLTNQIGMGSSEFHVLRINEELMNSKFVFAFLNRESIRKEAAKNMTGASGHRRVPISFYENMRLPNLPMEEQNKMVAQVESYKAKVRKAESIMASCAARKREILNKYLN